MQTPDQKPGDHCQDCRYLFSGGGKNYLPFLWSNQEPGLSLFENGPDYYCQLLRMRVKPLDSCHISSDNTTQSVAG